MGVAWSRGLQWSSFLLAQCPCQVGARLIICNNKVSANGSCQFPVLQLRAFQITHKGFHAVPWAPGSFMTCRLGSPISMSSSHLKFNKAKTELLSSYPLDKTPSKNKWSLPHFSKWHHQAPSCSSPKLKCHSWVLPLPPIHHLLSILSSCLLSWSSSLTWKAARVFSLTSQLPRLSCYRSFSAEWTGL